ncbi:MAG TPA: MBL fold metallo-hydrolase [Solirubrobacteraceae bacterium]|jgi:glyoxylase-like metal-dependent hydrolase (beta-lactamase superfamily II)|nr:MBL fold metallo-hydrolase [Solirubrobacteraceae bacterium]
MRAPVAIPLPLAHVGSVNAWLLPGDPVTLIDTGPRDDDALAALEAGLRREGLRVEDIELVLATHHHLDHVGLAATIQRRAGATVAVLDRIADYGARYGAEVEDDRRFARALMTHHGVPDQVVADSEDFWDFIRATTEDFQADVRLLDGDRVAAGGRSLQVLARPGHSTTDTLFVDDRDAIAFAGDHLLAAISSNTEICAPDRAQDGRARSRLRYLENLERTQEMPLARLLTGHGAPVTDHRRLVQARLRDHVRRCERILAVLDAGPRTAFEVAGGLWPERTLMQQPLLVVWEVVGNLELLLSAGAVAERVGDGGSVFELTGVGRAATAPRRRPRRRPVPDCAGRR